MKDVKPILQSLGLLESEIKTYMAALGHGPGTVLQFTKITGLSRQAVYVAIETLTERGLMASAMSGKKRMYNAEHPEKLLAYARRREVEMKEKIGELERIVPELELAVGGEKPIVRMFEGKEGVRTILADVQASGAKEVDEIADLQAMKTLFTPEDLRPLREAVQKTKPTLRGIYYGATASGIPIVTGDKLYLPAEEGGFNADIAVYGDKVMLVTFEGKMYSVILESRAIANALRKVFGFAHAALKEEQKRKSQ